MPAARHTSAARSSTKAPEPTAPPARHRPDAGPRPHDGNRVGPGGNPRSSRRHAETTRTPTAAQAIQEADGPALVLTSDPDLWEETKDARAKLGPVLLYDPAHLCDTPARLHWSPTAAARPETAAARAAALLAPVRPHGPIDQPWPKPRRPCCAAGCTPPR